MKRTLLALISLVLLVSVGFAQSRDASYPLTNGHKLIVTNLLKPELWGFFDNAGLAAALSKISDEYELSTDIYVAFNPTASYLYLPVQSIEFDLAKSSKIAAYASGEAANLPNALQKDIMLAVASWALSLYDNKADSAELRNALNKLIFPSPPRFICSISNKHRFIVLSGTLPTWNQVKFDPKIQWQDLSNPKAPFFATIAIPSPYNDYAFTTVQGRMYLENPDIPGNPSLKKDTIWIYKLFSLR